MLLRQLTDQHDTKNCFVIPNPALRGKLQEESVLTKQYTNEKIKNKQITTKTK
jgi:hypothetical protein